MQRASRGYSLIEVVVALFVFSVGALALAAGSAVVARSMNANSMRERATRIAESRLESIRAECGLATSGTEITNGVRSVWDVGADSLGANARESVSYQTPHGVRTDTYEARILCAR